MANLKQMSVLVAKIACQLQTPGRRTISVRPGDRFLVTSPQYRNGDDVLIDREKKAYANSGYRLSVADVRRFFDAVGDGPL